MSWLYLVLALSVVASGSRMLLRPHSFVGPSRFDATEPRTVRLFGWFFVILGGGITCLAIAALVKG
jgi:hypothetical protein